MAMGYDPDSRQLVVAQKGLAAIEHYLVVRYFMYAQIYNHPKNLCANWVLKQGFNRARWLLAEGKLEADATVTSWLTQPVSELSVAQYLAADDGVFLYHFQRWQQAPDLVLADLCRRYLNRDLLKAWEVTDLEEAQQQELHQNMQRQLAQEGWTPEYYTGIKMTFTRGYTLYQRGIKVQTLTGLCPLSDLSPLVRNLTQSYARTWLLYPREMEDHLLAWQS